ncbi:MULTISPECIES: Ppx/GppA phosphatase family protein [Methylobacterium]|uniref:Ppx/GppA phosphatase family protein n=1 Tax=Methylobacterium TaxID=407 RepID=UPI0010536254|nr:MULTISPECIES: Ppx/GppA phosphatase family protein [Methylobacterium]MDR7038089.1 exopolyphosphatase/guanosine-5'-triphosphate,3'-diphosphate pyrophosphatase [Methylobacterium sp. BE186]
MRDESAAAVPARPAAAGPSATRDGAPVTRFAGDPPRAAGAGAAPLRHAGPARQGRRNAYAALDLGTNNCRLLIAEPASHGFRVIDAFSRIVRLGEGLGNSDRLSEAAVERTVEALRICRAKMQSRGVVRAKIIATEACRLATNGADFVERVRSDVGLDLEIVDRQTEAYLAVTGCAALADPRAESVVIFDIGGGSTEIAWLDGAATNPSADPTLRIRAWDSLPVGVVTLAERHGGAEVTRMMFEGMVEEVADLLARFAIRAAAAATAANFHLLGTSGTVTTLAAMHLRLVRYERRRVDGLWMSDAEVTDAIEDLLDTRLEQRADNPCIGRDRADLVLAGCAILEAIRRAFPSERLRIADRGLREGLLMNMMREDGVWRRGGYR